MQIKAIVISDKLLPIDCSHPLVLEDGNKSMFDFSQKGGE